MAMTSTLLPQGLFEKRKLGGGPYGGNDGYRLTTVGRRLCHSLFNSVDGKFKDRVKIQPRCRIDKHGNCFQGMMNINEDEDDYNTNGIEIGEGDHDNRDVYRGVDGEALEQGDLEMLRAFNLAYHPSGARTPLGTSFSSHLDRVRDINVPRSEIITNDEMRRRRLQKLDPSSNTEVVNIDEDEDAQVKRAIEESKKTAQLSMISNSLSSSSSSSSRDGTDSNQCDFDLEVKNLVNIGLSLTDATNIVIDRGDCANAPKPKCRQTEEDEVFAKAIKISKEDTNLNQKRGRNGPDEFVIEDDDDDDDDVRNAIQLSLEQESKQEPPRKRRIIATSSTLQHEPSVISLIEDQPTVVYDFTIESPDESDVIIVGSSSSSSSVASSFKNTNSVELNINAANNDIIIAVDIRERLTNDNYRSFMSLIKRCCERLVPTVPAHQQRLTLGDFGFLTNVVTACKYDAIIDKDKSRILHCIVERKTLQDIIGQSAREQVLAHHVNQERRMRFCDLRRPIFLIEGLSGYGDKPMSYRDTDLLRPDVMYDYDGVLSYLVSIICRNVGMKRVYTLQTFSEAMTSSFLAALGKVMHSSNTLIVDTPILG